MTAGCWRCIQYPVQGRCWGCCGQHHPHPAAGARWQCQAICTGSPPTSTLCIQSFCCQRGYSDIRSNDKHVTLHPQPYLATLPLHVLVASCFTAYNVWDWTRVYHGLQYHCLFRYNQNGFAARMGQMLRWEQESSTQLNISWTGFVSSPPILSSFIRCCGACRLWRGCG